MGGCHWPSPIGVKKTVEKEPTKITTHTYR